MPGWAVTLLVLGALALLVTLLLLLRAHIVVCYHTSLTVALRVLCFHFPLYPKRKKPVRPSDFTARKLRRRKKKEERRAARAAKKRGKAGKGAGKEEKGVSFSDLPTLMEMLRQVAGVLIRRFFLHLRIDIVRMRLVIACGDAAKTAIAYGAVSQGAAVLLALLGEVTDVRYPRPDELSVTPDFAAETFSADIDLRFSLRVIHLLDILIKTAYNYLKGKRTVDAANEEK